MTEVSFCLADMLLALTVKYTYYFVSIHDFLSFFANKMTDNNKYILHIGNY